jgi:hypothetical protein
MVVLVIARARHTSKIGAKKGYFTGYLVLKDVSSLKTVCARTVRLSVPVIYFGYQDSYSRNSPFRFSKETSNRFVWGGSGVRTRCDA